MSRVRLRPEQIYEAMVDDEAFAILPTLLAQSTGARSCVIHWRDAREQSEIMGHSAYFSPEQMLDYAVNFVEHDQWSNVGREEPFVNRACNTKDVVDPATYERSIFYNEWIRAMGDDTFHCIGSVMETERGLGMIGLHRGKGQTDFDAKAFDALNRNLVHLRRMLTVRARLTVSGTQLRGMTALLDTSPYPMLAVNARGKIVHANAAAAALFEAGTMIRDVAGFLVATQPAAHGELCRAVARASHSQAPAASAVTLIGPGGQLLELTIAPGSDGGTGLVLVTGHDPDALIRNALICAGGGERLAPREIMVARLVAKGLRNREIAEQMGLSEGTVKVYLHNVFAKAGVATRTELALLIGAQGPR